MTPLTPEEARNQLATADTLATMTVRGARVGAFTTAGVGVLIGSVLAMSRAVGTNLVALAIGMGVSGLALCALMIWHFSRFRVQSRGWSRRYLVSIWITMALFTIGIRATSSSPSWMVFAPYCVLVALPMVFAAGRMARR